MVTLEIKGVPSKSEDVFFFTLSIPLLSTYTVECDSKEKASGSPLLRALFDLPWIIKVAAEGRALIVKKSSDSPPWNVAAPQVISVIKEIHTSGVAFFSDEYLSALKEKKKAESERGAKGQTNQVNVNSPLGLKIQEIIKEKIAPSLALHHGRVDLINVEDGRVYLYFGDGCQGCSQASVTLKEGIEKLLLKELPEIKSVIDVTDHRAGKNPFY